MNRRVLVLHPWFPRYREAFFLGAIAALRERDVELTVAHGSPPLEWAARGDSIERPWAVKVPTGYYRFGPVALAHRRISLAGYDLVILEQAIRNVENYLALLRRSRDTRLALWGHGRTYTKPHSVAEVRLKSWLTRRASWFFSYTRGGADYVVRHGFPASHVTVLENTIDASRLARERAGVTPAQSTALRRQLRLGPGPTALFVGGLDEAKRLPFLLSAGELIAERTPGFTLVVAGNGRCRDQVTDKLSWAPWLRYWGAASDSDKAQLSSVADVLMMPGRVGLVAVDSFALQVPIATTNWRFHAPEFEYLSHGENALIGADDPHSYANLVADALRDQGLLQTLRSGCARSGRHLTIDNMVERFREGTLEALTAA